MNTYPKSEIESEAAIYAEGTRFSRDDLISAWKTYRRPGERLQDFFERWLTEHPIDPEDPGKVCEEWLDGAHCAALKHIENPSWMECAQANTTIDGWLSDHFGEPCSITDDKTVLLEKSNRLATQDEIDTACQVIENHTA